MYYLALDIVSQERFLAWYNFKTFLRRHDDSETYVFVVSFYLSLALVYRYY